MRTGGGATEFKYLSDSRRHWREPAEEIIASEQFTRLHILTHAFWYHPQEQDLRTSIVSYLNEATPQRYAILSGNFRNLHEVVAPEEVSHKGGVLNVN